MIVVSKEKQIEQWIQSTIDITGIDIKLIHNPTGINMTYDFIKHHIGVDIKRVQEARKELELPISLEKYVNILTLHELGHACDRQALMASLPRTIEIYDMKKNHSLDEQYNNADLLAMRIEEHKMNIAFEETAWAYARKLNQQHTIADWNSFEKVKAHSLMTYKERYHRDLQIYKLLTEPYEEDIAG